MRPLTRAEYESVDWAVVGSSQIERAAWLDDVTGMTLLRAEVGDGVLLVHFKSKPEKGPSVYAYVGVPRPVYENLIAADSPGRMLNLTVKGAYEYARLEIEEERPS